MRISKEFVAGLVVVAIALLLAGGGIAASAGASGSDLKMVVPTSTRPPTPPLPTATSSPLPYPSTEIQWGGFIDLRARFPSNWPWNNLPWQDLWTVVQWRDNLGDWHDVLGWQGHLDDIDVGEAGQVVGEKRWWVAPADLGKGPFRWLVYQRRDGRLLAKSASFYLSNVREESKTVEVLLEVP